MSEPNAYQALNEGGDARWAFGTGFSDPLAGVDTAVPLGVDGADLAVYALMLGDDALILSQRLGEWVTRAPELEEEVALANIALDLLGQARLLLARAGVADGSGRDEDDLAFGRDEGAFRNVRLAETANGDFAYTMARLLVLSTWRLALVTRLATSVDTVLAAIAAKGVPELTYHRGHAADWVVRLGDGTDESHQRMQAGLDATWPLVDELFWCHPVERRLADASVAIDPAGLRSEFDAVLDAVVTASGLRRPRVSARSGVGGRTGRDGVHTEALGPLLAELQSVARAHPGATW
ncbi:MAG: phenylacetate-CoA oxygenase subunit PaaC [Actinomycetota bacterium]|nr:phenylacetate-CoA oxygenase subunit PaaC [Actinomycetota bacterium]